VTDGVTELDSYFIKQVAESETDLHVFGALAAFQIKLGDGTQHQKSVMDALYNTVYVHLLGVPHITCTLPEQICRECGVLVRVLDSTVSYNSKGELPMKIFSPFAGFLCVVAAFLLILLFVGVVSETGQPQIRRTWPHCI